MWYGLEMGRGSTGVTYLGELRSTGQRVAVKESLLEWADDGGWDTTPPQRLSKEISILEVVVLLNTNSALLCSTLQCLLQAPSESRQHAQWILHAQAQHKASLSPCTGAA